MSQSRRIVPDQPRSLIAQLRAWRIRHGDVAKEVEFVGLGFHEPLTGGIVAPSLHIAFCPSRIHYVKRIIRAPFYRRFFPFSEYVQWDYDALEVLQKTDFSTRGFTRLVCDVHAENVIHLANVRVVDVKNVPPHISVYQKGDYDRFLARIAL